MTIRTDDLRYHGDSELTPGLVDLAVNVRLRPRPAWLTAALAAALDDLTGYPNQATARAAVAARHGREPEEVLLTAGAAEAFTLLARVLRPHHAVVVHPQFTEPEAALRAQGHAVHRLVLRGDEGFRLGPVDERADLVVLGNPTNPTSVLHPATAISALAREGRTLVVDEAFADTIPGEPESLTGQRLPGLVVVRSLTKTWGLAGLRIGYVLAEPALIAVLAAEQPLWPVSTPALAAAVACSSPRARHTADAIAHELAEERAYLVKSLQTIRDVQIAGAPASSFVLLHVPDGEAVRTSLRTAGFAARRGSTFPGLGPDWLRIAVRDRATTDAFVAALKQAMSASNGPSGNGQ